MKVENVLIKPPSLVARLEGKANKALVEEAKEAIQKAEEKSKDLDLLKKQQRKREENNFFPPQKKLKKVKKGIDI